MKSLRVQFEKILSSKGKIRERLLERYLRQAPFDIEALQLYADSAEIQRYCALRPLKIQVFDNSIFAKDCASVFSQWGCELAFVQEKDNYISIFDRFKPDLCFFINCYPDAMRQALYRSVPVVCWHVDPIVNPKNEHYFHKDFIHPLVHHFCFDPSQVELFRAYGFCSVHPLPLASHPEHFAQKEPLPFRFDISFVGSTCYGEDLKSIYETVLAHLRHSRHSIERAYWQKVDFVLKKAVKMQMANLSSLCMEEILMSLCREEDLELPPPQWKMLVSDYSMGALANVLCRSVAFHVRVNGVLALANACLTVDVFGDDHWKQYAGPHMRFHGHAEHHKELPTIYQQSKINLHLKRFYARDTIPMRIFDIACAKGFLLCHATAGLDAYFQPDKEIVCFETFDELVEKARYYLAHDAERQAIAERAYARVLAQHTLSQRLQWMFSVLMQERIVVKNRLSSVESVKRL